MDPLRKPDNQSDMGVALDAPPPADPPIAVTGVKSFMILASALFFLPHLDIAAAIIMINQNETKFHDLFIGYKSVGNGYDIFCGIAVILCLAALSVPSPKLKKARLPLYILFVICHGYLALFILHTQTRASSAMKYRWIIIVYTILFSGAFSVLVNCMVFSGGKLKPGLGIGVSVFIGFVFVQSFKWIKPSFSFFLYEYGVYIGANVVYAWIINTDAKLMVERRAGQYKKADFPLAAGQFYTDPFFGFWKDLVTKPKPTATINDLVIDQNGEIAQKQLDL